MNDTGMIGDVGFTHLDTLAHDLSALKIIDIGTIYSYNAGTNRADVRLFSHTISKQNMVTGIEVITIGNDANGINSDYAGAPCLIFYPRSVVTSVRNREVDFGKRAFDPVGAKCLPISVCRNMTMKAGYNASGDFVFQSDNYVLTIGTDTIRYVNAAKSLSYTLSATEGFDKSEGSGKIHTEVQDDGSMYIYYETAEGLVAYILHYYTDGTYEVQRNAYEAWDEAAKDDHSTFEKYMWKEVTNADGSKEWLQKDVDGNPINDFTIGVDGAIHFTQSNADGDVLNDIAISAEGDITLSQTKAENTITLKQDGTCTINTKDAISVHATGALNIETDDACVIKAASGVTTDGDGGKVSVKNGQKSLYDILKGMLQILNTNLATQGSPAAHTVVPNQFQQQASDLDALME